ncbi:MAG: division/cell wall cluster transcriptional repressor MraZ [Lachnospiraceae bacterium]|nr:division/cell wall cluster transcriptional repressor MraZ [Lachnospiraceae bacterium]
MLMGEYNHTIDAKGRLIVPSKFREILGDEFVVTKGLDGCLFVYPDEEWKKFEEKLAGLPLAKADARKFARFFLAGATTCEVDKQGRILLPSILREFAALEKDVVLIGVSKRIEIWSKEKWNEVNIYDNVEELAENMSELGLGI